MSIRVSVDPEDPRKLTTDSESTPPEPLVAPGDATPRADIIPMHSVHIHRIDQRVTMNDGHSIPVLGFGTANIGDTETTAQAVMTAIQCGYRHIDTAQMYENEEGVGLGIQRSGVPRSELFVTTKLNNDRHTVDGVVSSLDESLERLGLDYVDLFLIHWPNPSESEGDWATVLPEVWDAMVDVQKAGKVRSIGVSNFRAHHLDALAHHGRPVPAVNQIKLCPGVTQDALVTECLSRGIVLTGYSPLGQPSVLKQPTVHAIAAAHQVTPAQVVLRWGLQMGFIPLPRSSNAERIEENSRLFHFMLDENEMQLLTELKSDTEPPSDPDKN